jgi:hypothetical protein
MADSDKNIRITTNKNKATLPPNIVFTGSSAGTSVLTLEVRDDNSIAFTGIDGDVFSLDYNLSTGTIWSVNDKSGTPLLRASAGGTIGIAELGTGVIVGIGQTNPKYKLDVQGWVGFASTGDGSYTVLIENGLATGNNALSIRAANALRFYNSGNTLYTGFKGVQSGVNTTYILPPTTPAATGTSVLSSSQDGVLSWVPLVAGGTGSPAGSSTEIQYNNGGSFGGATGMTWLQSTYLLQLNSLNQATAIAVALRLENGSATSGSPNTRWSPALEFVGRNGIATQYRNRFTTEVVPSGPDEYRAYLRFKYSFDTGTSSFNNNIFLIHSTLGIGIGASNTSFNNAIYFRAPSGITQDYAYVLPLSFPLAGGFGSSVLSSDTSGTLTWVPMAAGGTGSGTVNSGTGGSFAVYGSTGTAVNGTNLVTFAGSGVTIGGTTNASSTTVAALVVQGGLGITGNAFIGGTTTITNTSESTSTNSGALTVAGGAGIAKSLFVGTTVAVGGAPGYIIPNVLGTFVSTVNSYNQIVIQNRSSGTSASANLVVNNDISNDTTNYGEIGINSSTFSGTGALGVPNATYVAATSGPLVLGTTTSHPIRFTVNGGATDVLYISESGTAISCFTNFGMRSASDLRFWNSGNTFYAALQGGGNTVNYTMTLPTAPVGAGASVMVIGSDSNMYFAAPGAGIAFSNATTNTPTIRAKRALTLQFAAGYTPLAAGPDNVILKIPQAIDGVSLTTFQLRELDIRVETPSAGQSRIQLEKYTGTTAFTLGGGVGSSIVAGFGITLTGAGTYTTSTSFAAGVLTTSNDKLRLNWTLLNATHANFTVQLTMEEV